MITLAAGMAEEANKPGPRTAVAPKARSSRFNKAGKSCLRKIARCADSQVMPLQPVIIHATIQPKTTHQDLWDTP
jgi:hypothetical protein